MGLAGHACDLWGSLNAWNPLRLLFGSRILLHESLASLVLFWLFSLTPPTSFAFSLAHDNNRMLSMQDAGVLLVLMALLCACGPSVVRGQLTFEQSCGWDPNCCCRALTAIPTGIPTNTTSL